MAVFGFLLGSVLGLFGSLFGWLIWDISAMTAAGLYLGSGLVVGTLVISLCCLRETLGAQTQTQAFS